MKNKYLGKICKRGHEYKNTEKGLRFKSNGVCIVCNRISVRKWFKENYVPATLGGRRMSNPKFIKYQREVAMTKAKEQFPSDFK